ncbi:MAG: putative glycosyl transferase [Syntrophorhabdus sp. PtaU1.Bin050]|nr:MAG: putative glycosyl transferase [Syntrophorhabdus sp. PtaU1.Bin050]
MDNTRPLNIWIFNHHALTPNLPGGTRHFDFARELVKRHHSVTIFASSFHYSLLKETKEYGSGLYYVAEFVDRVRFFWFRTIPYSKNNIFRVLNMLSYSYRAYSQALMLKAEKPDLIIGSSVHLFAVYAAQKVAGKLKIPFVMEVRDLWPQTLIDMGVPKYHPFIVLLAGLERFLYKKAEKIITLLPKAHEYIEQIRVPRDKIVWIPNGVDAERSEKPKDLQANSGKFTVTYAGAIGKANNLDVLLQTALLLRDDYPAIRFCIVGNGPEKSRLVALSEDLSLNNVEFRDTQPKEKIYEILGASNALFFNLKDSPVFRYGISSNKLFDYLASGKPTIFSCKAGNNPVQEAGAGVTVSPENPKETANAILQLYNMSEEERVRMGRNGIDHVYENYSIRVLVDRLEDTLYEAWRYYRAHCQKNM